jgi:hypothetical protein
MNALSHVQRSYVALAYTIATAAFYFANETSTYLASSYAYFVWLLVRPAVGSYLIGSIMLVNGTVVRFEDVCTGLLLIGMAVVFLWLRGTGKMVLVGVSAILFCVNTLRAVLVILVLQHMGLPTAAALHDLFYFGLTAVSIAIAAYGVWPLLSGKGVTAKPAAGRVIEAG